MEMFDAVRIAKTPITEAAGYAGAEGVIFGITTVSLTKVEVIGEPEDDCAINVDFESAHQTAWFQPSLVEVTGRREMTISVGPQTLHRTDEGQWIKGSRKPWWKFWADR